CGGGGGASYLSKDYTDGNVFSGGWTEQKVIGNISWSIYSGSNNAAQITNYNYGTLSNTACETWYISPSVDLSASTSPVFNFRNVCRYNGSAMVVYVSTDYTSGAPSTATWTTLTCNLDANTSVWTWVDSGDVDFSAYKTSNVHVAFKYTGTDSDGRTWEIDDIYIQEP
ncbi:MAG: choice-of-anchor J domain-containing protein, partial [Bacteroidota bacterium]